MLPYSDPWEHVVYEAVRCVSCGVAGRGKPGFVGWKCSDCRPVAAEPETVADLFTGPTASVHQGSPYRCRDHHEVPVARNGRGCPECARSRQ